MGREVSRIVLGVCAFVVCSLATADQGVFVKRVPAAIDKPMALEAVREVFEETGWSVVGRDADSVTGKYMDQQIEARVRIVMVDRALRYEESAVALDAVRRGSSGGTNTPGRWIRTLMENAREALQERAIDLATSGERSGPYDRMAELRKMRDAALITADEYERKRAELLKAL